MFGDRLKRKLSKLRKLNQDVMLEKIFAGDSMDHQIVGLQQKQLYVKGEQSDGSPTGEYAPSTIAQKKAYGDAYGVPGRTDHITGLDTGETYRSMAVESLPEGFVITADDRNDFFKVIDKGLGLTQESKRELLPEIQEDILEEMKKAIA